jgi:hypothetical protein
LKNSELEELLKTAGLSKPKDDYWHQFATRVTEQIRLREVSRSLEAERRPLPRQIEDAFYIFQLVRKRVMTLAILAGCVCVSVGALLLIRNAEHRRGNEQQLADARKYYEEIATLFPNQLRAIILDPAGAHLELAAAPTVPSSPPIYVKICERSSCRRFITFSGQRIRIGGQICEVLMDRQGAVLLVGESWIWSSSEPGDRSRAYRIDAKALGTSS